jgi:FlaA1/EpsC-like NDP-sugar epimerase
MRLAEFVIGLPRPTKRIFALSVDAVLCVVTVWAAFALRLDGPVILQGVQHFAVLGSLLFAIPLFIVSGLYRAIFRYAGWPAMMAVVRACAIYALFYSAVFTTMGVAGIPRSVGVIQPILLFLAVGASRAAARYWLDGSYRAALGSFDGPRVLIYGAGASGRQLEAAIANAAEMHVAGFIDDDPSMVGSVLSGKKIYASSGLAATIAKLEVDQILLAIPSATRHRRAEVIEALRPLPILIRTLPGFMDLAQGKIAVADLRELDIEDLLGRDPVRPDALLLARNIQAKTVLVTGAGGSIGSELCRQILRGAPDRLLLVDSSEFALYAINEELKRINAELDHDCTLLPLLANVTDAVRMGQIMAAYRPDTVYHAAAYKHVPLVEHNPCIGVRNNVWGTMIAAQAAIDAGVADFVLISTDKAVRPTNIMGTSKRIAELVLQALANERPATRLSMVRFGNVLGSSGSVVPLFRKQIRDGGPVTLTHADITRYFMTIPEAAQLVIQAGAMAVGGEVFVLDMGDPVRIIDLARKMIELSGLSVRDAANPKGDIEIEVVGLRPAEKLFEELLIGDNADQTSHPRIMKGHEAMMGWEELQEMLSALDGSIKANNVEQLRMQLMTLVPEFSPEAEVVDYVSLETRPTDTSKVAEPLGLIPAEVQLS